jgi:protein required for attachment to host cells
MKKLKVKTGDWIVVCDGRKALILENVGDYAVPILHTNEVREHPDLSTRSEGSDEPGRVHQSIGHTRSAIDQTDWHHQAERAFLTALASRLHACRAHQGRNTSIGRDRIPASARHDPRGLFPHPA